MPLKKVLIFNIFEDQVSQSAYPEKFYRFLKMCGYTVNFLDQEDVDTEQPASLVGGQSILQRYTSIPLIDRDEAAQIEKKVKKREALYDEKMQLKKYSYRRWLKQDCDPLEEASVFFDIFDNSLHEQLFRNGYCEKTSTFEQAQLRDNQDSQYVELSQLGGFRLRYVRHIIDALGLRNSQDTETVVDRSKLESLTDWVQENRANLHSIFQLRDRAGKEQRKYKVTVGILNKILGAWTGSALTAHTIGHKKRVTKYCLEVSLPFLHLIKDKAGAGVPNE